MNETKRVLVVDVIILLLLTDNITKEVPNIYIFCISIHSIGCIVLIFLSFYSTDKLKSVHTSINNTFFHLIVFSNYALHVNLRDHPSSGASSFFNVLSRRLWSLETIADGKYRRFFLLHFMKNILSL